MKNKIVAIVGATGAVGREFIGCIESRRIDVKSLKLLASARSAGKTAPFRGQDLAIEELTDDSFEGVDIALFSAGSGISKHYAPLAVKAGAVAVDNSSAFRMDPDVPLVVPEINARRIAGHKGIIANPNCSAITALVPLWPIHQKNPIKRLIISTYQAASGAGAAAMQELVDSTRAYLDGKPFTPKVMPHPYAFNVFNHNTAIDPETGYNDEETKVIRETKKILEDDTIAIGVTCVRVPVLRAHSESITFECENPITEDDVRAILSEAPGVKIVDDRARNYFPMPIDASGQGDVLVGRIRKDLSDPSGKSIAIFVAADQLLKGAALNAVQIAELL
ncbi:MAG TPA: aspartate-semialdehyde dehydrogenase [Rhizomicrobium sp.]|jgi:aspartate-semialdehyde dehydrogenase|nr:aspartate-semialdehyde dehydrogenase [Rhizomicrobium sp.]